MKKIVSLVGASILALTSVSMIMAGDKGIKITNKGDAYQNITTTAIATSGDIKSTKFKGGSMTTGSAGAFATTEAIANQFTTRVHSNKKVEVKNEGEDVDQSLDTTANAFSGEVKVKFGAGNITTGLSQSESYTGAWANIFNTTVHH